MVTHLGDTDLHRSLGSCRKDKGLGSAETANCGNIASDFLRRIARVGRQQDQLAGSGAGTIGEQLRQRRSDVEALEIETIDARLLALAARTAEPGAHPPRPCYLREADARLPS